MKKLTLIALACAAGCAGPQPLPGSFPADGDHVRAAAKKVLAAHAEVEELPAKGILRTSWSASLPSEREQGVLLENRYKERVRFEIRLRPGGGKTEVDVLAWVQRRAPGGPRALRWESIPSDGRYERLLLDEIGSRLKGETK